MSDKLPVVCLGDSRLALGEPTVCDALGAIQHAVPGAKLADLVTQIDSAGAVLAGAVVVLSIGGNDVLDDTSIPAMIAAFRNALSALALHKPTAVLYLVGALPPRLAQRHKQYRTVLPLIKLLVPNELPWATVDLDTLTPLEAGADQLHFTGEANAKIAAHLATVIGSADGPVSTPASTPKRAVRAAHGAEIDTSAGPARTGRLRVWHGLVAGVAAGTVGLGLWLRRTRRR